MQPVGTGFFQNFMTFLHKIETIGQFDFFDLIIVSVIE